MIRLITAAVAATLLLAGCASRVPLNNPKPVDEALAWPKAAPSRAGVSGGVFSADTVSLTSDARAFRVGDIVTVLLQETTQASKKAGTSFSKSSDVTVDPLKALGKSFPKTAIGINADRGFQGDATSTQQNALSGAVTVIVQEVLPNGLLRVAGEKRLQLNQGEEFLRLRHRQRQPGVLAARGECPHRLLRPGYAGRRQYPRLADPLLHRSADAVLTADQGKI
jgi:flagellar L-ring protein precursor FlgH